MLINNIDIQNFNAQILNLDIQNSTFKNDNTNENIIEYFDILSEDVTLNKISVELLINSQDKKQYYIDRSNLLSILRKSFNLKFKDRDLEFKCILVNANSQAGTKQIRGKLNLELLGYNIDEPITEDLNRQLSKTINVKGNCKVPAIVEIVPVIDIIDIELRGLADDPILIKNLKASQKTVINGENGTVTCNGVNKFGDTDLWEFPRLVPGANTITLSKNNCDVKIKYKPRFI